METIETRKLVRVSVGAEEKSSSLRSFHYRHYGRGEKNVRSVSVRPKSVKFFPCRVAIPVRRHDHDCKTHRGIENIVIPSDEDRSGAGGELRMAARLWRLFRFPRAIWTRSSPISTTRRSITGRERFRRSIGRCSTNTGLNSMRSVFGTDDYAATKRRGDGTGRWPFGFDDVRSPRPLA
jgi:hypothetical protein